MVWNGGRLRLHNNAELKGLPFNAARVDFQSWI